MDPLQWVAQLLVASLAPIFFFTETKFELALIVRGQPNQCARDKPVVAAVHRDHAVAMPIAKQHRLWNRSYPTAELYALFVCVYSVFILSSTHVCVFLHLSLSQLLHHPNSLQKLCTLFSLPPSSSFPVIFAHRHGSVETVPTRPCSKRERPWKEVPY